MATVKFLYLVSTTILFFNVVDGVPFFRKDYTYINETDSFYKISSTRTTWFTAKKRCALEGAQLMIPENKREVDVVHEKLWKKRNIDAFVVWVGLTDEITEGLYVTIDGRSIDEVYTGWSPGQPDNKLNEDCAVICVENKEMYDGLCTDLHNYICKKTHATLDWNILCDLPDMYYKYDNDMGKCYKIHRNYKNWNDAHATCVAEQSYLAIVNSNKESDAIMKAVADQNKTKNLPNGQMHIGFHNRDGDGWVTVKGTSLDVAGFDQWSDGQPQHYSDPNYCGTISSKGELTETACDTLLFFICEHDIQTLNLSLDEKKTSR